MCESCSSGLNRRDFIKAGSLTASLFSVSLLQAAGEKAKQEGIANQREKKPAVLKAVFLYPLPESCDQGTAEAAWQEHHWHPYPGNQFCHREQQQKFTQKVGEIATRIGVRIDFAAKPLSTDAEVAQYIAQTKQEASDAILIFCFSDASIPKSHKIAMEINSPAIIYLPTGAHHQLVTASVAKAKRIHFIHSIENWDEIDRSIRAVHAKSMLSQGRVLRVGGYDKVQESVHPTLGTTIATIPAGVYNRLFDSLQPNDAIASAAMRFKSEASQVMDVTDERLIEAFRADQTVSQLLDRYTCDAITIDCLHLQHRKPCVSFSRHNGQMTATCGCENDITATMTMFLNRYLFGRPGFQHNPEYDEIRNHYFATHCTCATQLMGPNGPAQAYKIRPFFHHLPKTPAVDVQWTANTPVILSKMFSETDIRYFTGKVVGSPECPPTGGCATRVLVDFGVPDITEIYLGGHPVLSVGEAIETRCYKIFCKLFEAKEA